jgi:hypothetical protein
MGNSIGKKMLSRLQEIMRSKPNLISLCGIADDATEADLSGFGMDADDAIILASELSDKGALTSLNLSSNNIGEVDQEQAEQDVEVLLQSFGTGMEALEEHFEEPEDDSTAAIISMVSTQWIDHSLLTTYHTLSSNRLLLPLRRPRLTSLLTPSQNYQHALHRQALPPLPMPSRI